MTFGLENLGCRGDKVLGMSSVGVAVVLFVSFGVAASPWSRSIAAMFVVLYSVSLSLPFLKSLIIKRVKRNDEWRTSK